VRQNLALDTLSYGLIVGVSIGFAAGYLGSLMVIEKMALVGDALSHVALPGLALGYLLNFNPLIGGFVFLFVSAVLIWHLGRVTRLSFETLVGASFTLALAVGILMFGNDLEPLAEALFGDIARVGPVEAVVAIVVSIIVVFLTRATYKKIVLGLISEELASSKKIPIAKLNLLYLLLVSLTVAVGIQITGTLLVGFLVITPAAAARIISANLKRYFLLSGIFGVFSSVSGILLSNYLSSSGFAIPPGPLVVLSGIAVFAGTIIIRWSTKFSQ
jgi:ABC-type Mn2+/Zn2+ transport system permease subunit